MLMVIFSIAACQEVKKTPSIKSHNKQAQLPIFSDLKTLNIADASLPNLFVDNENNILLSYVTSSQDISSLWLVFLENDVWTEPELVASGNNWFINWADFPSVVKHDDNYFAHWLEKNGNGTYAYGVRYSVRSLDQTWTKPQWLHTDNSATEHGFVSLQPTTKGSHAIWLDGRNMQGADHDSHSEHAKTASLENIQGMTMRYAFINNQGQVNERTELDSLTCDCCQTTMVQTEDGVVVAYRDREPKNLTSEIRDIKILYNTSGDWIESENTPVDNWNLQACPVNGPVLSANNNKLALAWFTAADNKPKVQVAFSNDNGQQFQDAIVVDESNNLGRVAVDWINADTIFISWIGMKDNNTALLYRIVTVDGTVGEIQTATEIDMSRSSGVPQVAQIGDNKILLTWTETGELPSIQSKVITIN